MSQRLGLRDQDKNEAIAYTINWAADLNGSTISGAPTWTVPSGITNANTTNTTTTTSIRLSGGTPGVSYKIECTVTSAVSETMQAHFVVRITE